MMDRNKHKSNKAENFRASEVDENGDVLPFDEPYPDRLLNRESRREKGGFIQIPWQIVENQSLSPTEKILYGVLLSYSKKSGYAWASNKRYAEMLNVSKNTISAGIKNLKDFEFIRVENSQGPFRHIFMINDT